MNINVINHMFLVPVSTISSSMLLEELTQGMHRGINHDIGVRSVYSHVHEYLCSASLLLFTRANGAKPGIGSPFE
jgi:hypothetical protein